LDANQPVPTYDMSQPVPPYTLGGDQSTMGYGVGPQPPQQPYESGQPYGSGQPYPPDAFQPPYPAGQPYQQSPYQQSPYQQQYGAGQPYPPNAYQQTYAGPGMPPGSVYPPMASPVPQSNGLAVAALILGVLAVGGAFIPIVDIFAMLVGLVAIVLGIVAMRKKLNKGLAVAGTVLGAVALVIAIVTLIVGSLLFRTIDQTQPGQHKVVFTATVSSGQANAMWGSVSQSSQTFSGTWTKSEVYDDAAGLVSLTVTGDFSSQQTVTCDITIDGRDAYSFTGTSVAVCVAPLI